MKIIRVANSLPQSPAATAPSSEGAKGLECHLRNGLLRGSQEGRDMPFVPRRSCLPLTREVASPKGLTEGEIGRTLQGFAPAKAIKISNKSFLYNEKL
mgnify:CR=1 FL=1